jgi:hypothetical protein
VRGSVAPRCLEFELHLPGGVGIAKSFVDYGYDIQYTAYTSAIRQLGKGEVGHEEFEFLFYELSPPYAVTPAAPDGIARELGQRRWRRAVNTWAKCVRTGEWPEYVPQNSRAIIEVPAWALRKEGLDEFGDEI